MPHEIRIINGSEYQRAIEFYNGTRNLNRSAITGLRRMSEFRWEFIDGPGRKAIYAGAWDIEEGKEAVLIGTQCMIIHKVVSSDGTIRLAAKGEDTLLHINALSKYKNADVLKELNVFLTNICRDSGVEYLWGFNKIPATFRRLGYKTPFRSVNTVLVLNLVKTYQYLLLLRSEHRFWGKLKVATLSVLSYVYSLKRAVARTRQHGFHINNEIAENINLFQSASQHERLFSLYQDQDYLRWRIGENPYPVKYKSFQLLDQNHEVRACIICSLLNDNTAYIEQPLFSEDLKTQHINYLLKSLFRYLKNESVFLVRYTGTRNNSLNKREMNIMNNIGFVATGTGEWFNFKSLSDNPEITPDNIYLSHLYKQGRH